MQVKFTPRVAGIASELQAFVGDIGDWARGGVGRLSGAERRALAERFAVWANRGAGAGSGGVIDNATLRAWLAELDSDGCVALTEQLAAFCADFDIDLAWLVDGELADWPELEASVRALVMHYCLACKAAVDGDEALQRFRRRRIWRSKVKARDGTAPSVAASTRD